jgi:triacylglycerol lipase
VQVQVSGEALAATVPLRPDGRFEALFEAALPPARRGWRVARYQLTAVGQAARACNVVLMPPAGSSPVVVVALPLAFTWEAGGAQRLAQSPAGDRLAGLLQAVCRTPGQPAVPCPVYYLSAVPPEAPNRQAELALAATALGWPTGHFVLLPAARDGAGPALAEGLDRLRWLFSGGPDLVVLNREPSAEAALAGAVRPALDRAAVSRFTGQAGEDVVVPAVPLGPWEGLLLPRPTRLRRVPRYPLVFCHGMLAMTMLRMQLSEDTNYFSVLHPFLRARGVRALFPNVEPTGGVAARAEQLRDQVRRWTGEPINLIAHSMGGLDARFLISRLGLAPHVRSLTTIATPHRGSAVADWFCLNFRQRVPLLLTLEAFGVNVDGFQDCRPAVCADFNEHTPDAPGVRYFSYGGAVANGRVTPPLRRAWDILTRLEGPNDGLVSVRSARWDEYLGTLAVDHFAQTPDGLFVRPGENFDALGFYSRLIEDLARRGL